jgi:hypothetical protein
VKASNCCLIYNNQPGALRRAGCLFPCLTSLLLSSVTLHGFEGGFVTSVSRDLQPGRPDRSSRRSPNLLRSFLPNLLQFGCPAHGRAARPRWVVRSPTTSIRVVRLCTRSSLIGVFRGSPGPRNAACKVVSTCMPWLASSAARRRHRGNDLGLDRFGELREPLDCSARRRRSGAPRHRIDAASA